MIGFFEYWEDYFINNAPQIAALNDALFDTFCETFCKQMKKQMHDSIITASHEAKKRKSRNSAP
jgi:hypothetical protein